MSSKIDIVGVAL